MLEKSEYYHGAAIIGLLEDERCSVCKKESIGYIANNDIFIFLKYTTKARSPWGFTFNEDDINRCCQMSMKYQRVVVGLVCGGDGVCALEWCESDKLLNGKSGRIVAARKHNHSYTVWGTAGELKNKIPIGRWPLLVFKTDKNIV